MTAFSPPAKQLPQRGKVRLIRSKLNAAVANLFYYFIFRANVCGDGAGFPAPGCGAGWAVGPAPGRCRVAALSAQLGTSSGLSRWQRGDRARSQALCSVDILDGSALDVNSGVCLFGNVIFKNSLLF